MKKILLSLLPLGATFVLLAGCSGVPISAARQPVTNDVAASAAPPVAPSAQPVEGVHASEMAPSGASTLLVGPRPRGVPGLMNLIPAFPRPSSEHAVAIEASAAAARGPTSPGARYSVQKVFFGTDRHLAGSPSTPHFDATRANQLTYGEVDVSIPFSHRHGELESPFTFGGLRRHADPDRHITVLRTTALAGDAFWIALRHDLQAAPAESVLVFVHGFNVNFDDAARRTAQMAWDLGFVGAPMFFSWPSQGRLSQLAYSADEQAVANAQPHLEQFLRDILRYSGARHIYLIAHSMGHRALTRALGSLAATNPDGVQRIAEVILAAPDIDATEFTEQLAPALFRLGAPVTLYASSHDEALAVSDSWHHGARLGESGAHLVVLDGMETIDASAAQADLLGHSYYGQRTILDDMFYVISKDMRASERCCLRSMSLRRQPYWVFVK